MNSFGKGARDIVRLLRDHLRSWGVYLPYNNGPVIPHLIALLKKEEPVKWTDNIFQQLTKRKKVYSQELKQRETDQQISQPTSQERTNQSHPTQTGLANPLVNNREILPQSRGAITGIYRQNTDSTDLQQPTPVSINSIPLNTGVLQSQNNGVYHPNVSKALTDLSKLYSDDRLKFR